MRVLAFSVHILTACGAGLALLALLAATQGQWPLMFLWLGIALVVDAVDGPLARRVNVAQVLPRWSGETLDLVVDYATYVFVPAYAVAASGLMTETWAVAAALAIAVTGTLYFADREMKTQDNFFRGFPAVWNLIAFYLLLLRPASAICAVTIGLFAILTFVPIRFVHPLRVRRLRTVTVVLLAVWAALAAVALEQDLAPERGIAIGLCVIGVYFLGVGLIPPQHRSN